MFGQTGADQDVGDALQVRLDLPGAQFDGGAGQDRAMYRVR